MKHQEPIEGLLTDETVDPDVLHGRWVEGAHVVYIGKADALRRRLKQFADFGAGRPVHLHPGPVVADGVPVVADLVPRIDLLPGRPIRLKGGNPCRIAVRSTEDTSLDRRGGTP